MKKHIKLILRTLFSNNACVEAARTPEKKYTIISIIFVLFSLFFASLSTCVTGFQQQGGTIIRNVNYSFDTAMREFKEKANDTVKLRLTNNHELIGENWNITDIGHYSNHKEGDLKVEIDNLPCFVATMPDRTNEETFHKTMEIYYCDAKDEKTFTNFVADVIDNLNPVRTKDTPAEQKYLDRKKNSKDKWVKVDRSTSFIVFGRYNIQAGLYQRGTPVMASGIYGDYANTPATSDLIAKVLAAHTDNPNKVIEDCAKFFDQVYVNPRWNNTWKQTGIILGVDAGVVILMGFMVWILTRGKNNPFRIYTIWDGQKIAYYACLTPGILSLFGFLMTNLAMMLFILGVGVRIMWLSMRTLRYQAPAKQ